MRKNDYWLSDKMAKYIVAIPTGNYHSGGGDYILNPSIARTITTREGSMRAHINTYISPDCGEDAEIIAGEDGYPILKNVDKEV